MCKVSLHKQYDFYGDVPFDSSAGKVPMYPWVKKDFASVVDFKTVLDKQELGRVLEQAQLATLNPGQIPTQYANARADHHARRQVEFSPNVIVLEVSNVSEEAHLRFMI